MIRRSVVVTAVVTLDVILTVTLTVTATAILTGATNPAGQPDPDPGQEVVKGALSIANGGRIPLSALLMKIGRNFYPKICS